MSRLAAMREYSFLKGLYEHGFPVPTPYDQSRHSILMSWVDAHPFGQVRQVSHVGKLYSSLLNLIVKLAEHGLIHADFNEFNLLLSEDEQITLIDFPQMVSTSHPDAEVYFARDVSCITTYFRKRFGYTQGEFPASLAAVAPPGEGRNLIDLDKELEASGYKGAAAVSGGVSEQQRAEFEKYIMGKTDASAAAARSHDDGDNEDAAEEEEEEEAEDDDEDGDDEEAAAAALGVNADDLAASSSDAAPLGEEEAAALAKELAEREAGLEASAAKAKPSSKAKKSVKLAASAEDSKQADGAEEEEEAEAEKEEEEDEAHRASRMARKESRKAALQSKQAMQAARKAAEKARKAAERERAQNPALMAAWVAEQEAAKAAAAAAAPAAAATAASAVDPSAGAAGSDVDEAVSDEDDTRSQASHLSALSALSLGGKGNVLNIKLKPAVSTARVKTTNRNKGREMKKIQMSLKEHM